jgi:hypothetical protein
LSSSNDGPEIIQKSDIAQAPRSATVHPAAAFRRIFRRINPKGPPKGPRGVRR